MAVGLGGLVNPNKPWWYSQPWNYSSDPGGGGTTPFPQSGEGADVHGGTGSDPKTGTGEGGQRTDVNTGGSSAGAEDWYKNVILAQPDKYDTNISKDVWLSWFPAWNPQTQKFKSQKMDANGQPVTTEADKPTDCPEGTQAWGDTMCLPPGDQRLQQGQPPPTTAGAATADASKPLTLQDMLQAMFESRSSIFGMNNGRDPTAQGFKGAFGIDQYGNQLPDAPDLASVPLSGGGLVWAPGGTDLSAFQGAAAPKTSTTPTGALTNSANTTWAPPTADVAALGGVLGLQKSQNFAGGAVGGQSLFGAQAASGQQTLANVLSGNSFFGAQKKQSSSPLAQMLGAA